MLLFQGVYVRGGCTLTVAESYQITMAGLAATRLFAAGGAGGIALTAWALRRAGMKRRAGRRPHDRVPRAEVRRLHGRAGHRRAGPALRALRGPRAVDDDRAAGDHRRRRDRARAADGADADRPAAAPGGLRAARRPRRAARCSGWRTSRRRCRPGVRYAIAHIRDRDPAIVGAVAFWGFQHRDACGRRFQAFGEAPPWAVIVMGYFVGMLANLLPLPGRRRRGRRRHDRRVRRVRRGRSSRRWWPC